jgi:AcrR family transcriptional regulator
VTTLRERKKQRTRDQIVGAAMELFAERGFDRTTISDIAEAADISPRTFFGYFPTKEDVVFHDAEATLETFAAWMRGRAEDEDPFDALRSWALEYEGHAHFDEPEERIRRVLIRDTPALAARERTVIAAIERIIAEAVADELGIEATSLRANLVGAAAVAALDAIACLHDEGQAPRSAEDVLDEALTFLQGGLEALRRRSPAQDA